MRPKAEEPVVTQQELTTPVRVEKSVEEEALELWQRWFGPGSDPRKTTEE